MKTFHVGLGTIEITRDKLNINIYKPSTVNGPSDEAVLFCNHDTENTYEYYEHEIINSHNRTDKFIVDITYDGKSVAEPVFEYMKSKYVFTQENRVGDSIMIGQDNIMKAIHIFYDDEELFGCITQTIIDSIKSKYNLTDEQYISIYEELECVKKISGELET
tara:strand:+ start:75 stop:560 length:486 start_codon:yes stop_codon:yes gene_type:complete